MQTGEEGEVENYPTPDELWNETFAETNAWRDRFAGVPFEDKGGTWEARYYQHNAINKTLEAMASGKDRILLTLATGTGKTFIAFQLAWKLFQSKWNLSREPERRPRILFLADRNILADQAFNSFSAFEEDALVRIAPDEISKKGRVPKNGSIFFTIFQTFMSGSNENGEPEPYFGEYPKDFFDFIVIDECHRGGAKDESSMAGNTGVLLTGGAAGADGYPQAGAQCRYLRLFWPPCVCILAEGGNQRWLPHPLSGESNFHDYR